MYYFILIYIQHFFKYSSTNNRSSGKVTLIFLELPLINNGVYPKYSKADASSVILILSLIIFFRQFLSKFNGNNCGVNACHRFLRFKVDKIFFLYYSL